MEKVGPRATPFRVLRFTFLTDHESDFQEEGQMPFCTDTDLLYWEPNLLSQVPFASQTLMVGTGDLSGTSLVISSGSFVTNNIEAGQVVHLTGPVSGCFPIVSVDSATQLTVSVLYQGIDPLEE